MHINYRRSNTFGNWPVSKQQEDTATESNAKHKETAHSQCASISELEVQTKQNLLKARKLRRKYDIYVFPESETTPLPIFKFNQLSAGDLRIHQTLSANLKKWKIHKPLPVQMQVIPIMLQGHELQVCAPTGSGKTLSFIIPILTILQRTIDLDSCQSFCDEDNEDDDNTDTDKHGEHEMSYNNVKCLVVAPTTVLAHQIYREFVKYSNALNIGVCLLDEQNVNSENDQAIPIHVLISTPKPMATLIRKNEIPFKQIQIVVLDEADELFDGDTALYVDDIELIISKCNHPQIQRAFFSATLDDKIMNLTQKFLNDPYKISIGHGVVGAANVEQELIYCGDERGKFCQLLKIIEDGLKPPILLFVSENKRILELKRQLEAFQSHLVIDALHQELSIKEKNEIITRFRDENIWFLICNDELSRGMDFLNVETVINYDFPRSSQQYIHRIGRTGRADRVGKAITFWSDVDNSLLSIVVGVMKQSNQQHKIPEWMLKSRSINKKMSEQQRLKAKLGVTKRGKIRRGGEYVHGTSVLKDGTHDTQNANKTPKQKSKHYKQKKRLYNQRKRDKTKNKNSKAKKRKNTK